MIGRLWTWTIETIKHPVEVSTIFPSSKHLARHMVSLMDLEKPVDILELGPADGAITDPLVEQMHPESRLVTVESNKRFCDILKDKYKGQQKSDAIEIVEGRAEDMAEIREERGIDGFDYVVSGLPLASFSNDLSEDIVQKTYDNLRDSGAFIQFQYSLKSQETISEIFDSLETSKVWKNLWFKPTHVYYAMKKRG